MTVSRHPSISLSEQHRRLVDGLVAAGRYQGVSEVVQVVRRHVEARRRLVAPAAVEQVAAPVQRREDVEPRHAAARAARLPVVLVHRDVTGYDVLPNARFAGLARAIKAPSRD